LTVVTNSNAQRHGMVMWDEIAAETARDFPEVTLDKELVDAMTTRMVLRPGTLDTIVATNLHADILSDLAAALAGSLGIAPTANLNPELTAPSMFEPIHGSAFDITGKGIANPVGTFWTASMMLEHLGEHAALGPKLGPLLVQLPPNLAFEPDVADAFLRLLRERHDGAVALEPRHPGWFGEEAGAVLQAWRVARVAADPARVPEAAEP